ncbi:hypothetical protein L6258_01140, partial [Candidatus Parcubacteria bacterium]|nr:hypothetical protein [Candidatus Parcubacteria bacterium]
MKKIVAFLSRVFRSRRVSRLEIELPSAPRDLGVFSQQVEDCVGQLRGVQHGYCSPSGVIVVQFLSDRVSRSEILNALKAGGLITGEETVRSV